MPPRSGAMPSRTAETAPAACGTSNQEVRRHVEPGGSPDIAETGRVGWQRASGRNGRAQAEMPMPRFKRVIGDGLRPRTGRRRATGAGVAVRVLNRVLDLGRPILVRIAWQERGQGCCAHLADPCGVTSRRRSSLNESVLHSVTCLPKPGKFAWISNR